MEATRNTADFTAMIDHTLADKGAVVISTRGSSRNKVIAACAVARTHLGDKVTVIPWSEDGREICLVIAMDPHIAWTAFGEVVDKVTYASLQYDPASVDLDILNNGLEELRLRIGDDQDVILPTFTVTQERLMRKFAY